MDVSPRDGRAAQTVQRVKVGVTGLALVLLLIVLAGALLRAAGHERAGASASRADLAANLSQANAADPTGEPLAEIGAAPSDESNGSAPARPR